MPIADMAFAFVSQQAVKVVAGLVRNRNPEMPPPPPPLVSAAAPETLPPLLSARPMGGRPAPRTAYPDLGATQGAGGATVGSDVPSAPAAAPNSEALIAWYDKAVQEGVPADEALSRLKALLGPGA